MIYSMLLYSKSINFIKKNLLNYKLNFIYNKIITIIL